MKDGICSKCGSNEVYFNPKTGELMNQYGVNTIPIKGGIFGASSAVLDNYVCGRCGYVESYILDNRKLLEIVKNWTRAARE